MSGVAGEIYGLESCEMGARLVVEVVGVLVMRILNDVKHWLYFGSRCCFVVGPFLVYWISKYVIFLTCNFRRLMFMCSLVAVRMSLL